MTDDQWAVFILLVLVVDVLVIGIAASRLWGPPPALIGPYL